MFNAHLPQMHEESEECDLSKNGTFILNSYEDFMITKQLLLLHLRMKYWRRYRNERSVRHLVLSTGNIRSVGRDAFQLRSLRTICLRNNTLDEVGLSVGVFSGLDKLRALSARRMNIITLYQGLFGGLTSLRRLDMSVNCIHLIVTLVFDDLVALETLDLSRNRIAQIYSRALIGLVSLRELSLRRNIINKMQASIVKGLTSLRYLDLAHNRISEMGVATVETMQALKGLYLSYNELRSLRENEFRAVIGLEIFTVGGNPIVCDCHLFWMSKLTYVKIQRFKYDRDDLNSAIFCYDKNVTLTAGIYKLQECNGY